jgi:hypothetical protein
MRSLARVPDIMQRGRNAFREGHQSADLQDETRSLYETFKVTLTELQMRWAAIETPSANKYSRLALVQLHAHYQRSYALGLAIGIILNCVLSAFDAEDSKLMLESTYFSQEILALAEHAARYRPVGASYMVLCLLAAWAGTTDKPLRSLVERTLDDYHQDFAQLNLENSTFELEWMSQHMRLQRPGCRSDQSRESKDATPT